MCSFVWMCWLAITCMASISVNTSELDQLPSVKVEVPNTVEIDKTFKLTFTSQSKLENYQLAFSVDFEVIGEPTISMSTTVKDGKVTQAKHLTYVLRSLHKGRLLLPVLTMQADGKKITSPSRYINVVSLSKQASKAAIPQDSLFVKAIVDKKTVRMGESTLLTLKIYYLLDIQSVMVSPIDIPYCYIEEQEVKESDVNSDEAFQNKIYKTFVYRRFKLTPLQKGQIHILPVQFTFDVKEKPKSIDPFDAFFEKCDIVKRKVSTNPVTIHVIP